MLIQDYAPSCPWPRLNSESLDFDRTQQEVFPLNMMIGSDITSVELLQKQIQLSQLINQINNEIRSTLDLNEILSATCRLLGQTMQCSRAVILVKESDEEESFITKGEYTNGNYPQQIGIKVPCLDNPLQAIISEEKTLAVTNFRDFPNLGQSAQELAEQLEIQSMLLIATRYQGRVNGVIGVQQCDQMREWTDWEQQLLEGIASQLAIAINQAQLYAQTRRQAERESLLRLVSNQIRSTLDLKTILNTAVREVRQLLKTDRVVIYQFKEDWQGEIVVEDLVVPWPSIVGEMVADNCFSGNYANWYLQGRVRAIHDIAQAGLEACHLKFLADLQVKANLVVPIVIGGETECDGTLNSCKLQKRLWGLLIAHECQDVRIWHPEEMEFMRQLGEQMAIAIQQAELYAQVQEAAVKSQTQAQKLQKILEELQATQQQLIQSEKMSSLGQMVAGIAHEVNNANNFIHANLFHAKEYSRTLTEAINQLAQVCPKGTEALAEIAEALDLDYIEEDFPKLLKSMREGSERIRSIVLALRSFSHLDEAKFKAIDLNEGIESCFAVLHNRIKSETKIYKEYGDLPLVECLAGEINQVFFNLLSNALDAIELTGNPGELRLKTWRSQADWVKISIRDNGAGIASTIKDKIFDPFFTTKPVGQGTGLGLSICYQVVVKGHGGQIYFHSEVGKGTEFIVELPLRKKDEILANSSLE